MLEPVHWLLPSAASDTDLIVCLRACPWIFRSVSSLMVEEATNPLLSISIGQNLVLKPCCFTLLRNFLSSLGLLRDCELLSYMQSYVHHRPLCRMNLVFSSPRRLAILQSTLREIVWTFLMQDEAKPRNKNIAPSPCFHPVRLFQVYILSYILNLKHKYLTYKNELEWHLAECIPHPRSPSIQSSPIQYQLATTVSF